MSIRQWRVLRILYLVMTLPLPIGSYIILSTGHPWLIAAVTSLIVLPALVCGIWTFDTMLQKATAERTVYGYGVIRSFAFYTYIPVAVLVMLIIQLVMTDTVIWKIQMFVLASTTIVCSIVERHTTAED